MSIYTLNLVDGAKIDKNIAHQLKSYYNNNLFDIKNPKYKLVEIEDDYYSFIIRWKVIFIITVNKDGGDPLLLLALINER
ncbi:MAG: hypothetical protein WD512_06945 [Candidatus Paceibacterota bacterium]